MKEAIKMKFTIKQDNMYPLSSLATIHLKLKCSGKNAEEIFKDIKEVLSKRLKKEN